MIKRLSEAAKASIVTRTAEGESQLCIARSLGVTRKTVEYHLKRHREGPKPPPDPAAKTERYKRVLALKAQGFTHEQAAKAVGVSASRFLEILDEACAWAKEQGLPVPKRRSEGGCYTKEKRAARLLAITELLTKGATNPEIALKMGVSLSYANNLVCEARVWAKKNLLPHQRPKRWRVLDGRPDIDAPQIQRSAWGFIVGECVRAYGPEAVAAELDVTIDRVIGWSFGSNTPSSAQQDALWIVLCAAKAATVGGPYALEDMDERLRSRESLLRRRKSA